MELTPLQLVLIISSGVFVLSYTYIVYIKHVYRLFKSYIDEWNECFLCLGFWGALIFSLALKFFGIQVNYNLDITHSIVYYLLLAFASLYSYKVSPLFNIVKERRVFPFNLEKVGTLLTLIFPILMIQALLYISGTLFEVINFSLVSSFLSVLYKKVLEVLNEKN